MANAEVVFDGLSGGFRDKNRTIFIAFASDDEFAAVEID